MNRILKYIENRTKGETYKSHRFCFDAEFHLPSLTYDETTEFNLIKDQSAETDDKIKESKNLVGLARELPTPLFRYFLDGSRRIYKIDDIKLGDRLFPILGGQIGVACCERQNSSTFTKALMQKHFVIALPSLAGSEGGSRPELFFNHMMAEINKSDYLRNFGIEFSEVLTYNSNKNDNGKKEEYMDRGTAQIQDKMIRCEQELVAQLAQKNLLNEDNYLIKDGSLQYQNSKGKGFTLENAQTRSNYRRVVGVSKSFNPELSKSKNGKSNAANIANLPLYHRTPAAKYQTERSGNTYFAIWYVRIREKNYTESPFAGILKIEKILSANEADVGVESTEIDIITANIINERSPVCYGNDQRWANHLYPVYLTEKYIKSLFLSDFHFLNLF